MSFLSSLSHSLVNTLEPYGAPGLMLIAIGDSSFLSLPEVNDLALMALSIKNPASMWGLAAMTVLGSIIGCSLLYAVGRKGGEALLTKRFAAKKIAKVRTWYDKYGMLAVIVPSLLPPPLPFKIFVLSAGAFRISWPRFILSVAIGRSIRYFTEGVIAISYGEQAIQIVRQNSARVGLLLAGLIVVGTLIFVYSRRRRPHASMLLLPLLCTVLLFSGCIVHTRTLSDAQKMKESHPFTRAEALDKLRKFSEVIDTLQTDISLSGSIPDPKDKDKVTDFGPFTGGLTVQRPWQISLNASFVSYGFEMRSDGANYEVYISNPRQVHEGAEADLTAKSSCKLSERVDSFINIRPRQIMEAVVPDFRPLLDSPTVQVVNHLLPVPQDQRTYFILEFLDVSATAEPPRVLQQVWFDLSSDNVDIVRRLTFNRNGEVERDTKYDNQSPLGNRGVRYPRRFDVQFIPLRTLLKITFVETKKSDLNEKVDPENFALGTHRNSEVCRMVPAAVAKQ